MYIKHFSQWRNRKEAEGEKEKGGEEEGGGNQADGESGKGLALRGDWEGKSCSNEEHSIGQCLANREAVSDSRCCSQGVGKVAFKRTKSSISQIRLWLLLRERNRGEAEGELEGTR